MNLPNLVLASFAAVSMLTVWARGHSADAAPPSPALAGLEQSAQGGQNGYSLRSLRGPHGFSYSGSHLTRGAIASSGIIRFDGGGGVSADFTTSVGGTSFTGSFLGTYTVNPDGTGSIVVNLPWLGLQGHGNFVLVDHADATFFTSTDAGYSVTGSTRKM